jgi:hypothetical protein
VTRKFSVCLALLLVLVSPLWAEVKIDGEVKIGLNSFASLTVNRDAGDQVAWMVLPAPVKMVDRKDGSVQFSGLPGTHYSVGVTVVNFDKKTITSLTTEVEFLGGTIPPAPPVPPVPPDVPPAPPVPVDGATAFQKSLKQAISLDPPDDVEATMDNLLAFYAKAVSTVSKAASWEDLYLKMGKDADDLGLRGHLLKTQGAIAAELSTKLPFGENTSAVPFDSKGKQRARDTFRRVSRDLARVSP